MTRPPKSLGGYDVGDPIGRGGMGEVYLSKHQLLERPAAVKRLALPKEVDPDSAEGKTWRERFLREGRALSKIQHEHVVAIYDLFEHRKELYMALELVDGFSAAQMLRAGPLPVDVACLVAVGVARGLEAAHHVGIIHRDVKPANVMVSKAGVTKLMDFGIARDDDLDKLTQTGALVGTPSYMAPELVNGQPPSEATDVYALGAMLYELLSGRRLMAHAVQANVFALISKGNFPRLGKVAPRLPWRLVLLVERCLKKDPKRRPKTGELVRLLEGIVDGHDSRTDHAGRLAGYLAEQVQPALAGDSTQQDPVSVELSDISPMVVQPIIRPRRLWLAITISALAASLGYVALYTSHLTPWLQSITKAFTR